MQNDRRQAYKLRVYIDTIKSVESMSDAEWLAQWVENANADSDWLPRETWLSYLKQCAIVEADRMTTDSEDVKTIGTDVA